MKATLTTDQDQDLRAFFEGALSAAAGLRSSMGPQLERLQWRLLGRVVVDASEPAAQERALEALRRHEVVRAALCGIQPYHAEALRVYYMPCPREATRGLARDFPDGLAPLALIFLDGERLRELVDRARAQNGHRKATKNAQAQERLGKLRVECREALVGAQRAYAPVQREAARQWRDMRRGPTMRVA